MMLNHRHFDNEHFDFHIGDVVTVNTRSRRQGQKGTVHSFTAQKVRVIFCDGKKIAYFKKSLLQENGSRQKQVFSTQQTEQKQSSHYPFEAAKNCQNDGYSLDNAIVLKALLLELTRIFENVNENY